MRPLPDTVLEDFSGADLESMVGKLVSADVPVNALDARVGTASRFRWIIHGRLRFSRVMIR